MLFYLTYSLSCGKAPSMVNSRKKIKLYILPKIMGQKTNSQTARNFSSARNFPGCPKNLGRNEKLFFSLYKGARNYQAEWKFSKWPKFQASRFFQKNFPKFLGRNEFFPTFIIFTGNTKIPKVPDLFLASRNNAYSITKKRKKRAILCTCLLNSLLQFTQDQSHPISLCLSLYVLTVNTQYLD